MAYFKALQVSYCTPSAAAERVLTLKIPDIISTQIVTHSLQQV